MMLKILYGTDTGWIQLAEQCCVIDVPEDVPENELETYLALHAFEKDGSVVGFSEAREILQLVLDAEVGDANLKYKILMAFADAVVNSFH